MLTELWEQHPGCCQYGTDVLRALGLQESCSEIPPFTEAPSPLVVPAAAETMDLAPLGAGLAAISIIGPGIGIGILARTGLGPLGPITPPAGIVLTCVLFGLQMAASRWWLARFRFGPVEWLWRSLSYLQPQPLRR